MVLVPSHSVSSPARYSQTLPNFKGGAYAWIPLPLPSGPSFTLAFVCYHFSHFFLSCFHRSKRRHPGIHTASTLYPGYANLNRIKKPCLLLFLWMLVNNYSFFWHKHVLRVFLFCPIEFFFHASMCSPSSSPLHAVGVIFSGGGRGRSWRGSSRRRGTQPTCRRCRTGRNGQTRGSHR